jgi:AcrR family transcriptional regulator
VPPSAPQRPRTGRPPRISRQEIIAAARRIVESEGVQHLTMRRLAKDIGSTPMALYHHVRDKDQLLVLLLDDYAEGVPRPDLPDDPRERLLTAAQAMHDGLADFPWIVEVLTSDDLFAISGLWYPEHIIDGAIGCGLTPEQAVHTYRTIWYYTAGEIIIHGRARTDRPTYREQVFPDLDPQTLPRLASLGDRWVSLTAEDTYRQGLRAIVNGLLATPID